MTLNLHKMSPTRVLQLEVFLQKYKPDLAVFTECDLEANPPMFDGFKCYPSAPSSGKVRTVCYVAAYLRHSVVTRPTVESPLQLVPVRVEIGGRVIIVVYRPTGSWATRSREALWMSAKPVQVSSGL